MKKLLLLIALALGFTLSLGAEPQATATFNILLTFSGATQAAANANRDEVAGDYGAAYGLDIFVLDVDGKPTTVIDPAKAAAAIRAHIRQHIANVVIGYRARKAGQTAQTTTEATEKSKVIIQD